MPDPSRPWRRVAELGGLAVLLIRHGQTHFNAQKLFCGGRSDPPLDELGRTQALALAQRFAGEVERVYASPLQRARETAAVLGEPTIIEELRELDQGALEGCEHHLAVVEHAEFFRAWKRDPTHVSVPGGGESMGALADRVTRGMSRVLRDHDATNLDSGTLAGPAPAPGGPVAGPSPPARGRTVAVVAHQMAQAAFVCRALGKPLRHSSEFELRNATANLLVWDGHAWSLLARNL
jgi:broad specificity phosphatase PhoE